MILSAAALAPLGVTIKVATCATLISTSFGVALAWILARLRFWGQDWLDAAATLPLVLPPTALGYYLIVLLGGDSWIGHFLQKNFGVTLMFTWQGGVIAGAIASFPLIVKSARSAIEGVEVNFENAARVLGSSEIGVFLRVTLPLAARGILAGVMLAYAHVMGEFGAILMIAGDIPGRTQTVSMAIFDAVQNGENGLANTLSAIISGLCVLILVISGKLLKPRF